jgi:hypothetical protein
MSRARMIFGTIATLLCATTARAADPEPQSAPSTPWAARFIRGTSPGEPSGAKLATVVSLYSAGLASLAGGVVFTLQGIATGTDAEDFARRQPEGFCADRASENCAGYLDLRRDESDQLLVGQALFGSSALLVLSGALTAELWSNHQVELSASARPGGMTLNFSADF